VLTRPSTTCLRVLVQYAGQGPDPSTTAPPVWGMGYELETHLLQVNISNLRRKIEPDPSGRAISLPRWVSAIG